MKKQELSMELLLKGSRKHVIASVPLVFLIYLSSPIHAQSEVDANRFPAARTLPMERRPFEQIREPNVDDSSGVLKYGGYLWRDVNVTQRNHRAVGKNIGGATVELIMHKSAYPYVIKDFYGTFRVAAGGPKNQLKPKDNIKLIGGVGSETNGDWRFMNWATADGAAKGMVCLYLEAKGDAVFGGIAGWYYRENERLNTLMIRFDQLDGVPVQLIDDYLKKYPSSLVQDDFHGESWVADDVHKWLHLTQLHKSDRMMFELSLGRLAAYDREIFGARDAFMAAVAGMRAEDMAAVDQTIETIRAKAEQWLLDRDKKKTS